MAISSIVFAIILYVADQKITKSKSWKNITFKEALIIGLWQVMAFIPGASRAGVTITGARFLKFNRFNATKFSMLLSIPIILASLSLSLINFYNSSASVTNLYPSIFASFVAFITALLSITFMMRLILITNFNIFILYRILLGIFIFLFV